MKIISNNQTNTNYELLKVSEAAHYLNVSKNTLYQWSSSKKIPCHKLHGRLCFDKQELNEFIRLNAKETQNNFFKYQ